MTWEKARVKCWRALVIAPSLVTPLSQQMSQKESGNSGNSIEFCGDVASIHCPLSVGSSQSVRKADKWKINCQAMAPHSSALAWKTPRTEEPGGLQSMGSRRVGCDWATSLSLFTVTHWRRQWQPTPVLLPGESQGRGRLVGCHLWGRTESDWSDLEAAALWKIQSCVIGEKKEEDLPEDQVW